MSERLQTASLMILAAGVAVGLWMLLIADKPADVRQDLREIKAEMKEIREDVSGIHEKLDSP